MPRWASLTEYIGFTVEIAELKTGREVTTLSVRQMLRTVKNWNGVVDDAGDPVPFSEEMLAQALEFPWFRAAINKALTVSQNGEAALLKRFGFNLRHIRQL